MKTTDASLDLSFVILTWNSENYIEKCFFSIEAALKDIGLFYEIFIIDNGSCDATPDILKKLKEKYPSIINLILLPKNMGTTYSRNLGITKAKGKFVCIMDSDVEIFPGTIETLIKNIEENPSVGLAVPKLLYPNGKLQKSTDVFPTVFRKIVRYFFLRKIEAQDETDFSINKPIFIDYAISAFWMMKRNIFNEVGFLDEKIFYSPEDVDYCLRIWKARYSILYDPTVSAVHHTQEISRGLKINAALFNHIKGLVYYFLKHRYLFKSPVFRQ